ncbi:MAG: aspartate aminotransferase family protein [Myxococcales bacterium]|nr:aspartate aminotransferase family protein [Myxococcales bacterium]
MAGRRSATLLVDTSSTLSARASSGAGHTSGVILMSGFPSTGQSRASINASLADARSRDLKADGRAFAFIYDAGGETRELARETYSACMSINGLDPTAYPSARTLELGLVGACLELMRASEGAVGTATAGGTESVMLAVKAARDHAKKARPELLRPKMLLPVTAHACFHKAAHYLGVEIVPVAVDATFRASLEDLRSQWTDDVILVVGSAPSYAHGVVDPIEGMAQLAREHGALMHVDACVGGLVLPFLRDLGMPVPAFDFRVEGVTSMSLDLHKYGFAPKGSSMLLMRDRALRDAQYYACATWTGYTIVNSTTLGSKSLAAAGAALAVISHLGRDGYVRLARAMWEATALLVAAVKARPELRLLAEPDMNLFAFTTTDGDLFELADRLAECGWHVQPTYGYGPSPAHIHLTIDPTNAPNAAEFARDLESCLVGLPARMEPPQEVVAMLALLGDEANGAALEPAMLMASLGIKDGVLPARAAAIHRILDAASPSLREQLMVLFIGELFA